MTIDIYIKKSSIYKKLMYLLIYHGEIKEYEYIGQYKPSTKKLKNYTKPAFYQRYIDPENLEKSINDLNKKFNKKDIYFYPPKR